MRPLSENREEGRADRLWQFFWIAFAIAAVGWLLVCAYALGAL